MADNVLSENLSEPLGGVTTAKLDVNSGTGNLAIDQLASREQLLASGTLEYVESQGRPTRTLDLNQGQATLTLKGRGIRRSWFRFPWAPCTYATEWQIHLNPAVSSDITAHSDGGNVRLNLAGMSVSRLSADTGGGNMDVVLPDHAVNLTAAAKTGAGNVSVEIGRGITGRNLVDASSGAGNVVVQLPMGIPARVHATTGLGTATVDARLCKMDSNTYQSADYDGAADRFEITVRSGAGNVSVIPR